MGEQIQIQTAHETLCGSYMYNRLSPRWHAAAAAFLTGVLLGACQIAKMAKNRLKNLSFDKSRASIVTKIRYLIE